MKQRETNAMREEEVVEVLLRDEHAASNPSFQAFLNAKRLEIASKKDQTFSDCSTPTITSPMLSSLSCPQRKGPKSRYDCTEDQTDVSSVSRSIEDSIFSFTAIEELTKPRSSPRSRTHTDARMPELPSSAKPTSLQVPEIEDPPLSPRERHLLKLYEQEKLRAEEERKKAQEAVLAMREKQVQDKERFLEQMMELMRAQAGILPAQKVFALNSDKAKESSKCSGTWATSATNTPHQEEVVYGRMISNDSEALRDEYEQNFESAVLEEDNFDISHAQSPKVTDRRNVGFSATKEQRRP